LRILFIHNKYLKSSGGEDTTVESEMNLLSEYGHDVELLLFDNARELHSSVAKLKAGIEAIYSRDAAKRLDARLQTFRPDLVHVHNFFFTASPSVILQASRRGIPVVLTIQNFRLICANALLLRNNEVCELCVNHMFPWFGVKYRCYHNSMIESAMVGTMAAVHKLISTWKKKVDFYITPAEFIRAKLINSSLRLSEQKIGVKRNFIKDPGAAAADQRGNDFLFVGRLSVEKGVRLLLQTFAELPSAGLVIVGDGPEREDLTREFGHLTNVKFAGLKKKDEVLAMLKKSKALIFPSIWYEGLPLTIIEAFATGTPVIASNLGAMGEMIEDKKNGFLFPKGDKLALKIVLEAFDGKVAAENYRIYSDARKTYENHFHPDKSYHDVMAIYQQVVKSKPAV
jgi:glycosyltransferase involved in cell wall biosynthesis